MKAKLRRIYAAVMALAITISLVTVPVQAAEAPQFSDVDGHWGEEAIVRWADYGVIEGSNGQFNPDAPITRAEMAAVIARLLGLTETAPNTFTDVEAGAWYAQAILRCAAAGIIQGSNGMANPNGTLTRQEAAVMLGRALGIQPDEGDVAFLDGEQVAGWAAGYVSVMSDRGILNGVGGNQFAPLEDINRASVVTVLNNAVTAYANEPGATVQASGGIALVVAEDVTVTGTAEDVLIVAGGDVTVAADVSGSVTVSAEGAGVTVAENAVVGTVAVSGGSAAVTVEADASVSTLAVAESASGASVTVAADAAVETVTVAAPESSVTVSGSVGAVEAAETAGNADITVGADATVDSITTAAAGTDITVSGTVETVTVAGTAGSTTVTANRGAEITSVDNSAEDVTISGSGTVERVTTSGNDTAINTDGTELTVAEGVTGTTENNKDVDAGETVTTDRPTSGGGSSSGGSSHSHSYTDGVCSCGAISSDATSVANETELQAALAANETLIVLTADFSVDSKITVNYATTINGNSHKITTDATTWTGGSDNATKHMMGIEGVAGAVTIRNLTLDSGSAAYGVQAFNSSAVTLNNVTLQNSAGSGLTVNGSAVYATNLSVSGSAWGQSIDVSRGSGVETAATLNLNNVDGLSDTRKIVEDNEATAAVTVGGTQWYAAGKFVSDNNGGYYVKYEYSADVEATDNGHVQVSTAAELQTAMENSDDHYIVLTNNIDMTGAETLVLSNGQLVNSFTGTLDGKGNTISASTSRSFDLVYDTVGNATFKNLVIEQNENLLGLTNAANYTSNVGTVTFENITVNSKEGTKAKIGNNVSSFVDFVGGKPGSAVIFKNCTNAAILELGIGGNYAGIFVGGYILGGVADTDEAEAVMTGTLTFENCVNAGSLMGPHVGFFTGNECDKPNVDCITITDCRNEGNLIGTISAGWFACSAGGTSEKTKAANEKAETALENSTGTKKVLDTNDLNLKLSVSTGGKLMPGAAENSEIATYEISIYAQNSFARPDGTSGGSSYVWLTEEVNAGGTTTTLEKLANIRAEDESDKITWDTVTDLEIYSDSRYVIRNEENGKVMIVNTADMLKGFYNNVNYTVTLDSEPTYRVNAYDSSGNLIGTVILKNNQLLDTASSATEAGDPAEETPEAVTAE